MAPTDATSAEAPVAAPADAAAAAEVALFRHQLSIVHGVLHTNVAGVGHDASLIRPRPAGNCLNFVVGHLVHGIEATLRRLGREPVLAGDALARYARGSAPITDAAQAWPLPDLLDAWDRTVERLDGALAELGPDDLDAPGPWGGDGTVRDYLNFTLFHQAYHVGQAGLLRRIAGMDGAIP